MTSRGPRRSREDARPRDDRRRPRSKEPIFRGTDMTLAALLPQNAKGFNVLEHGVVAFLKSIENKLVEEYGDFGTFISADEYWELDDPDQPAQPYDRHNMVSQAEWEIWKEKKKWVYSKNAQSELDRPKMYALIWNQTSPQSRAILEAHADWTDLTIGTLRDPLELARLIRKTHTA